MTPLKVAIDAQLLPDGSAGGVMQFVMGLVHALGRLDDGAEEYIIIGPSHAPDWLEPHRGPNQTIVRGHRPRYLPVKRLLGPLRAPAARLWKTMRRTVSRQARVVPQSGGFYESVGAQVVHFPHQRYTQCDLPVIFNPHDLQHLHYPEFFSSEDLSWRSVVYPAACNGAKAVAVESQWVKQDIVRHFGTNPANVYVVRWGSPTEFYEPVTPETRAAVRKKFALPETFVFYPAQTWPHKNHVRLLETIHRLRDRSGLRFDLVCTGTQNQFWPNIERRRRELKLEGQVRFLGFVQPAELRALYHLSEFVVLPSLFEGGGFPVLEAFREGAPVACSAATALPEYGGDAVLLFDASSVDSIAGALRRMHAEPSLRLSLRRRGAERIRCFPWDRTARAYRALYRKAAGRQLSDEERRLLEECLSESPPEGESRLEAGPPFELSNKKRE